jgi:hypothetical protein
LSFLLEWSGILCVPGGLLWALSPTGISISNLAFHTPNVFWKMFWSAPLLILLGLIGLQLRQSERSGLLEKLGFFLAIVGLLLIIAGDIGLYWLGIDDHLHFIIEAADDVRLSNAGNSLKPCLDFILCKAAHLGHVEFRGWQEFRRLGKLRNQFSQAKRTESKILRVGDPLQLFAKFGMTIRECEHFLECVTTGVRPLCDGQAGRAALAVCLAAEASLASEGAEVPLSEIERTKDFERSEGGRDL